MMTIAGCSYFFIIVLPNGATGLDGIAAPDFFRKMFAQKFLTS